MKGQIVQTKSFNLHSRPEDSFVFHVNNMMYVYVLENLLF